MAQGDRLDEQECLRIKKLYDELGSIKAVADKLGKYRQWVAYRVEHAEDILKNKPEEIILPDFPNDDLPIERIIDLMEQRADKRKKSYEAHTWFPVQVTDDKPIGVLWFGDPHLDDAGADWGLIKHHANLCKTTPGLYGANIGDTTNNWAGSLVRLYANQDTSKKTAQRLAQWFMLDSGIQWLVWLLGNHDAWQDGAEILKLMSQKHKTQKIICHDWETRFCLKFPNNELIRIHAAHDFPGTSQWNPLHGPTKAARFGNNIDLLVCGHTHNWAISQYELADQGSIPCMIRVKGYKTYDSYAIRLGHYEQKEGAAILTVINPKAKTQAGRVTPFADIDNGVGYLKWLRSKS